MENIDIDIDIDKDNLKNIDIDIDIDMAILKNIDIDIDIDKGILQNIDIDKISYRLGFGISNTPTLQLEMSVLCWVPNLRINTQNVDHGPCLIYISHY